MLAFVPAEPEAQRMRASAFMRATFLEEFRLCLRFGLRFRRLVREGALALCGARLLAVAPQQSRTVRPKQPKHNVSSGARTKAPRRGARRSLCSNTHDLAMHFVPLRAPPPHSMDPLGGSTHAEAGGRRGRCA